MTMSPSSSASCAMLDRDPGKPSRSLSSLNRKMLRCPAVALGRGHRGAGCLSCPKPRRPAPLNVAAHEGERGRWIFFQVAPACRIDVRALACHDLAGEGWKYE
jgi:hypothetical protein